MEPFDKFRNFPAAAPLHIDDPSHARPGIHVFPDRLHVLTMLENPLRWRARYRNFEAFQRHVEDSGAILYVAEIAFGERKFEITNPANPRHLQIRTDREPWAYEMWHKEGALNLLLNRLPPEAKYIAWIDSDVHFARPDWAQETMHLLQHYQFLQMFSYTQDLGPDSEPLGRSQGYVFTKLMQPEVEHSGYYYYGRKGGLWVHPGFCWAARRDALNHVGGLIDFAILGSGDWIMGSALFGEVHRALSPEYHPTYNRWAHIWQERAEKYIRHNVGYMPGLVYHRFHGKKVNRNYDTRWHLLTETQFNPETDLKKDICGLWTLCDRPDGDTRLRDGLRKFARLRDEDGTEV